MENSIHSTWKSPGTFPHPANTVFHSSIRQPVIHIPTMPATNKSQSAFLLFIDVEINI